MNIEKISIRLAFIFLLIWVIILFGSKYLPAEMFVYYHPLYIVSFYLGVILMGVNTIFSFNHLKMHKRIVLEMFCIFITLIIMLLIDFSVINKEYGIIVCISFLIFGLSRNDINKKLRSKS